MVCAIAGFFLQFALGRIEGVFGLTAASFADQAGGKFQARAAQRDTILLDQNDMLLAGFVSSSGRMTAARMPRARLTYSQRPRCLGGEEACPASGFLQAFPHRDAVV